jgi:hypothetical protein
VIEPPCRSRACNFPPRDQKFKGASLRASQQAFASILHELKLDWLAGLFLDNNGAISHVTTDHEFSDLDLNYITTA